MANYGSDFCTGGTPIASSSYPGYPASKAFDNLITDPYFWSSGQVALPEWIGYDLGVGVTKIAQKFTIVPRRLGDPNSTPTNFKFQGSNDNFVSDINDLHIVTGETWVDNTKKEYTFSNSTAYRYYRIYVTSTPSGFYVQLYEIEMMEALGISDEETINILELIELEEFKQYEESIEIDESIIIKNATSSNSSETFKISELLEIYADISKGEAISINEEAIISQSLEKIDESEIISMDEYGVIDSTGKIDIIFNTDLRTLLNKTKTYFTQLYTSHLSSKIYQTKLYLQSIANDIFNTDLRVRYDDYDSINIGSLNDFIVKKDGTEMTDVDYSSLKIIYNLNSTPSEASFILARRHDNFNYTLEGVYSQVDNENKIEIYDGTRKLFTGYITQIQGISYNDTVQILAQDARYKLSRNSLKIWYGGKYKTTSEIKGSVNSYSQLPTSNNSYGDIYQVEPSYYWWGSESSSGGLGNWHRLSEEYIHLEKNIGQALSQVFSACSPYLSSICSPSFSTSHVPEYIEIENPLSNLLDTLINQTANANWYVNEYEVLCYQKVAQGSINEIPLSSISSHRHAYDAILSDVILNRQNSSYAKSLRIKLGKHVVKRWARRTFTGWGYGDAWVKFVNNLKEKVSFGFQQWGDMGKKWYTGILGTIYSYYGGNQGWVLKATIVTQYQSKNTEADLNDITVGSGSPSRTIYLNYYGKKEVNERWEEEQIGDEVWLVSVTEESYNSLNYATDLANFELSQTNALQTEATVSLLLDAFKYYNLTLESLVNLTNTIGTNIYKNSNGFPLNISRIEIDGRTRIVTLSLTNYGKSWHVKTGSTNSNYTPLRKVKLYKKEPLQRFSNL